MDKIDSDDFEAKRVFEGLLKTQTLKNLVQTNLEIQAEIKSLDHDVQSLVFENYSKFISSIDVVKKMREEVEKTEADLNKLTESIDRIKRYTTNIDETLKPKRAEIQRLDRINKDLSNLKILCELPVMLKDDLKQLHALDLLTLSSEELNKIKPEIFKLLRKSLDSLNLCKDKLIEFCKESLIAPIFADVNKYLKEIQNYMFLHFYDNNTKMSLDLLSDAFIKLANIIWLNDMMNPSKKTQNNQNSIENLILIFFKYAQSHIQRQCTNLVQGLGSGQVVMNLSEEHSFEGKKSYDEYKSSFTDFMKKNTTPSGLQQLRDFFHVVFQSFSGIDKQFVKMGLGNTVMSFFTLKKNGMYKKFLFDTLSKTLDCNFVSKMQIISENKHFMGESAQFDQLIEFLVEEVFMRDILCVFDQVCQREKTKIVSKEFIDLKQGKFPLIRDEMNLKNELSAQSDSFSIEIRNYSQFVCETVEKMTQNNANSTLQFNFESILYLLLDRIISSQNHKINSKVQVKIFKKKEISLDTSQLNESKIKDVIKTNSSHVIEEVQENQVKKVQLKGGHKLLNYVFISRLLHGNSENISKTQHNDLFRKFTCAIFSFLEKEILRFFAQIVEKPSDLKLQNELYNLIKNLVFFVNNIVHEGIPKSRLTKQVITTAYVKSSETSKLLARQTNFFEDSHGVSRQKLFFSFTKLFFKIVKVNFIQNEFMVVNYTGLFSVFAQISQILFESCEKEDESSFAALFYQGIDDFEKAGFSIDVQKRNLIFAKNKEQIF